MQLAPIPAIVSPATLFRAAGEKLDLAATRIEAAMDQAVPSLELVDRAVRGAQDASRLVRSAITPSTPAGIARIGEAAIQHVRTGVSLLQHYQRLASDDGSAPGRSIATFNSGPDWLEHLLGSALTEFAAAGATLRLVR